MNGYRAAAAVRPPGARDDAGFVLALVVFMLFAVGVAAAAGYQMVGAEFAVATQAREGQKALVIARAGLNKFLSQQIGVVGDSVLYAIGDGVAVVTKHKLYEQNVANHMYYVRSEGQVADPRTPDDPTVRSVGTYAWHRVRPFTPRAAIVGTMDELEVISGGVVIGFDASSSSSCAAGGTALPGAVVLNHVDEQSGSYVYGIPDGVVYPSSAAVYDSIGLRWDILTDTGFLVDFDGNAGVPPFASLPADSFPLIRYTGSNKFGNEWDGRGVLIVTGEFDADPDFDWDGIILAGSLDDHIDARTIEGLLVGGFNGKNPDLKVQWHGYVRYHGCYAHAAARSLSYLDAVPNTVFEVN